MERHCRRSLSSSSSSSMKKDGRCCGRRPSPRRPESPPAGPAADAVLSVDGTGSDSVVPSEPVGFSKPTARMDRRKLGVEVPAEGMVGVRSILPLPQAYAWAWRKLCRMTSALWARFSSSTGEVGHCEETPRALMSRRDEICCSSGERSRRDAARFRHCASSASRSRRDRSCTSPRATARSSAIASARILVWTKWI